MGSAPQAPTTTPALRRAPRITGRAAADYFRKVSFVIPALFLLLILTAYPLFQVIQMSLYDYSDTSAPVFSGLANFQAMFTSSQFWNATVNTLVFTVSSSAICLLIGLALALALDQAISERARAAFRSVFMLPWLFASAVVGAIWTMMLNPFGLINHLLGSVGLSGLAETGWLSEPRLAMAAVVATNVWRSVPFWMLMILAGLQSIPAELHEAAQLDGAGFMRRVFSIILPQLKPILLTVATLETIWNFRTFDMIFIMTGGGPLERTQVLSTHVYAQAFRGLDFGAASATSLFMLVVMVGLSFFYLRAAIRQEEAS